MRALSGLYRARRFLSTRLDNLGQAIHSTHPHEIPGPDFLSPFFTRQVHAARRNRLINMLLQDTARFAQGKVDGGGSGEEICVCVFFFAQRSVLFCSRWRLCCFLRLRMCL